MRRPRTLIRQVPAHFNPPDLFDRLPPHKTLFGCAPGKGLPIGNLNSQFFANVYLNALDQFASKWGRTTV